jgi:hypothetical protein
MWIREFAPVLTAISIGAVISSPTAVHATVNVRIGVYFDAAGTMCSGTIRPDQPGTIYILAKAEPGTEIPSGAEFRFTGLPSSWAVYPVPNPNTLSLGDPFAHGVNIASVGSPCAEPGTIPVLLLYTVLVLASETVDDVRFDLVQRDPPSNPAWTCPLVVGCGLPYEKYCVETDPCFVNVSTPAPCVVTAVERTTWTALRGLYR